MTNEEMQSIKGKNWKYKLNQRLKRERRWNRNAWYNRSFNWWRIYFGGSLVCAGLSQYVPHPATKLFGLLGGVYLSTIGQAHLNEGWWIYGN